jgi:hypothetical protein
MGNLMREASIKNFSSLQEHRIVAQYTTTGTLEQNSVAERRNITLINMVRSMLRTSGLPTFLWGEALTTTTTF